MRWYINDLSLAGQFWDVGEFLEELKRLLALRRRPDLSALRILVTRTLSDRRVTRDQGFREIMQQVHDKTLRSVVLRWLTQDGPFLDDDRQDHPDDYFEYQSYDVTDQGLGEAARRILAGTEAGTFSFDCCSTPPCSLSPLSVQHGLREDPFGYIPVGNVWRVEELEASALAAAPLPQNWTQAVALMRARFPNLILANTIEGVLGPHPFNLYVFERCMELLNVLHNYLASRAETGRHTDKSREIIEKHFAGGKAWFTDESISNKRDFERQLTFPDPESPEDRIFCPWHGKIKTPQYRIHFGWPVQAEDRRIKVVYIGPKITKG